MRQATPKDYKLFSALWEEYLKEVEGTGSDIRMTRMNLRFFQDIFDAYTKSELKGVVLLAAEDNAALMWGETPGSLEMKWDHPAIGYGTYVRPEYRNHGVSKDLRQWAMELLKQMGFDVLIATSSKNNELGKRTLLDLGAKVYQETMVLKLR